MGNKVRGYRNMMGLTQEELGDELGVTAQSISAKEKGRTRFTDREKVILLRLFKRVDDDLTIEKLFFYEESIEKYRKEEGVCS